MSDRRRATDRTRSHSPAQVALVERACRLIDQEFSEEGEAGRISLQELAEELGKSPWHLQRLFKRVMGISPKDYAEARRAECFRGELKRGVSVAEATYGAGYGSSSRVYEKSDRVLGMTPASYAKGGAGAAITYAIGPSPLGQLLIASTPKGVCFVALGDDEAALEAELRQEFPSAETITRDDAENRQALKLLVDYLKGKAPHLDLPLDVQATAFQRRVWQELMAIPYGETRSYSELAEVLGLPKGQRAVGRACATNPVSLIIPCHRVTRDNGELASYRWGVKRKKTLIEQELQAAE